MVNPKDQYVTKPAETEENMLPAVLSAKLVIIIPEKFLGHPILHQYLQEISQVVTIYSRENKKIVYPEFQ